VNAIRVPLGDHAGSDSAQSADAVRSTWPVPSAFITPMSVVPFVQQVVYAIEPPSGDQAGSASISGLRVSRRSCRPSARMA
jgi:hypothetical protein